MIDQENPELIAYMDTLVEAIHQCDTQAIDQWFSNEPMKDEHGNELENAEFRDILFNHLKITRKPFTHHIGSKLRLSRDQAEYDDILYHDEGVKQRDVAVLKHFAFATQLDFLSGVMNERANIHYIEALNFQTGNAEHLNILKEHTNTPHLLSQLLYEEQFDALSLFHEKTQTDLINLEFGRVYLRSYFLEEVTQFKEWSFFWLEKPEIELSPACDLIINYTQNKENWFIEQGLALPDKAQLQRIKDIIMGKVREEFPPSYEPYWLQQFRPYEIKLHFEQLSHTIEANFQDNHQPEKFKL